MKKITFFVLPLLLLFPALIFGGTTGKIAGTVTDMKTGEVLTGVNIVLEETVLGTASDANGEYFIINIPPGTYSVSAIFVGYKKVTVTDVQISPDRTTKIDFKLEEKLIEGETITVVAKRPLIQKDVTFTTSITTAEEIENMPVYTVGEVMSLNAGFIVTGEGSADGTEAIHVRGGRANEIVYMVDGFYVKDPHSGGLAADVPSKGIQDLSVLTGTFNAEYGEAMSGVVNIVTKEGSVNYHGSASVGTDQFGIDELNNGTMRADADLSGPIPFLGKRGNFFLSGDYLDTDTYLHEFKSHVHDADGNPITRVHHPLTFDKRQRYTGKVVLRPLDNIKLILGYNGSREKQRLYNDLFKEIPDHNGFDYSNSTLYNFTMTHTLSEKMFYNFKVGYFKYNYKHELYSNLDRIKRPILVSDAFGGTSNYEFYGTYFEGVVDGDSVWATSDDDFWQDYTTTEFSILGDITNQIHKNHLLKLGFEYKAYEIAEDRIDGVNEDGIGKHREETHYNYKPLKFSTYIQDKMEFDRFIVNAGLRFDYLDAKAQYLPDLSNPDANSLKDTKPKYRFSPRIGFGHPLTENIRLHFAYGHFYQFPDFNMMYRRVNMNDPAGTINVTVGYRPRIGNPNLKPQTTIAYEFGTEIALSNEIVADVTVFYKDIYDYIATEFFDVDPRPYMAIVNLDYANSKGFEFSIKKRFSKHYSFGLNYTYSRAEGNADSWMTHFNELQNASVTGLIPPKNTVTLGWDQPHTLNFQFDVRWLNNWGVNVIGSFGSGLPYTPTDARGKYLGEPNSARMPWTGTIDMRLNKDFHFLGFTQRLYMNIWNLLDRRNVLNVYTNSGRPDYSTNPNTSEEAMNNPHWYGPPRRIETGLQVMF